MTSTSRRSELNTPTVDQQLFVARWVDPRLSKHSRWTKLTLKLHRIWRIDLCRRCWLIEACIVWDLEKVARLQCPGMVPYDVRRRDTSLTVIVCVGLPVLVRFHLRFEHPILVAFSYAETGLKTKRNHNVRSSAMPRSCPVAVMIQWTIWHRICFVIRQNTSLHLRRPLAACRVWLYWDRLVLADVLLSCKRMVLLWVSIW